MKYKLSQCLTKGNTVAGEDGCIGLVQDKTSVWSNISTFNDIRLYILSTLQAKLSESSRSHQACYAIKTVQTNHSYSFLAIVAGPSNSNRSTTVLITGSSPEDTISLSNNMKHRVLFDQEGHYTPAAAGNIVMENQYPSLFRIYYDDLTKL
ncbi:hypothetical protein WN51_00327 [Melipona quadrifasciata]|uniref:Uncharacterized protein n=1 Tax=Melipona quadrifasciata TaxID=166423 RepID=A0A0M8ZZE6_9HYME|nr:hypothetical protein WN51_00327 [Melipona quadrifasciata]